MKITVIAPVLNEIRFIKAWYRNVCKFADEIIVIDTNSTDGTYEYLYGAQSSGLHLYRYIPWTNTNPYEWEEHKIRNFLIDSASGDWIIPLDADELVGDSFIESLNYLDGALIHRYLQIAPWGIRDNKYMLRKRRIWPLCERLEGKIRWLRNWRGQWPCYTPRVFKRDDRIRYAATGNHCMIEYKNYGRMSYHLPRICKTHRDVFFYHFHYLYKSTNVRDKEIPKQLIKYQNKDFPKEQSLIK